LDISAVALVFLRFDGGESSKVGYVWMTTHIYSEGTLTFGFNHELGSGFQLSFEMIQPKID